MVTENIQSAWIDLKLYGRFYCPRPSHLKINKRNSTNIQCSWTVDMLFFWEGNRWCTKFQEMPSSTWTLSDPLQLVILRTVRPCWLAKGIVSIGSSIPRIVDVSGIVTGIVCTSLRQFSRQQYMSNTKCSLSCSCYDKSISDQQTWNKYLGVNMTGLKNVCLPWMQYSFVPSI